MAERVRGKLIPFVLIVLFALGACAEAELVAHTAKQLQAEPEEAAAEEKGHYKIGTPYQIAGVWYYPRVDYEYRETGIASWYGPGFHSKRTANGEIFDQNLLTAAHPTLPLPSMARVTNLENGRSITVRINDRGPFKNGRVIDVSRRAAQLLGFEQSGTAKALVEIMTPESRQIAALALREQAMASAPSAAPIVAVTADSSLRDSQIVMDGAAIEPGEAPRPATRIAAAQSEPAPQPVVTRRAVGPTSIYVQAGSFTQIENATQLRARLSALGESRIHPAHISGRQFYRVRLGPVPSVEEADRLLALLVGNGYTSVNLVVD